MDNPAEFAPIRSICEVQMSSSQCSQLRLSGYADKSWCGRCATLMIMWLDRQCEITPETNLRIPVSVSGASGRSPPASILYPDNRNCEHCMSMRLRPLQVSPD